MIAEIRGHLSRHIRTMEVVSRDLSPEIEKVVRVIAAALGEGHKILVMGNGGSAADAQHFAAELVGRFLGERKALPALALTTDTSILTSIGNDFGFDEIFRRQVEAHARPGDVVLGISTSGKSNNVFHALTCANEIGCRTLALLGRDGGNIAGIADLSLIVPGEDTPQIQEAQLTILHILCDQVEGLLFPAPGADARR